MNTEEIKRVQSYRGDPVEEQWKPSLVEEKPYVDWFYYWEFRHALAAGDLTHVRPLRPNNSVTVKAVYQHERLKGYYYSAFVRFAVMLEHFRLLNDMFKSNIFDAINPAKPTLWEVIFQFEGFYHFLGSVLDMLGGVGNILYSFEGHEDSLSNFSSQLKSLGTKTASEVQIEAFLSGIEGIKAYRDHIVHRPAFAQWRDIVRRRENGQVGIAKDVFIERDYTLGRAEGMKMWRKVLRDMVEGRTPRVSIIELAHEHKRQMEEFGNLLFQCFLERLPQYLNENQLRILLDRTSEIADLDNLPNDAEFVFYLCPVCERRNSPLAIWMQRLTEPTNKCINLVRSDSFPSDIINCDNPNIVPLFFVTTSAF